MKIFSSFLILGFLAVSCRENIPDTEGRKPAGERSVASELQALYDLTLLPEFLDSAVCAQTSSFDTTGNNEDGFNGAYSFIRRNADSSLVIFDTKGSGVINRIWTPTPTSDTLDFYMDDDHFPSFSIRYMDLFTGKKFPFVAPLCGNQLGGYYCYMPIPFEKRCMIVCRGKKMQFHQIQYRLYKPGTRVKSFRPALEPLAINELDRIASLWNKKNRTVEDFYPSKLSGSSVHLKIKPGSNPVFSLHHGGRILGIEIAPAKVFEGLLKNTDIKITWDGETNPAVYCPLADFFGYAFGKASMQSLILGSRDNTNYCYFPMPFDRGAKIELVCRGGDHQATPPVQVSVRVWFTSVARDTAKEGKFYACWNNNKNAERGKPHVFVRVKGKGHYVGTILQAQGLRAGMTYFFEGDDSAAIDGKFRIHGTGSEDYFNGGWYAMLDRWDGKMSLPIHGALDYSLPFCRTGGYRLYLSDKLSFEKRFYMSIEHGPAGNQVPVNYTSLAIYYSDIPNEESTSPAPEMTGIFIPDTLIIYPQLMDYNLYGNMDVKTTWKYGTGGESYLLTPGKDSWLRISLSDMPHGKYAVYFDVIKEPFGCEFSVWQRQTQCSDWINTYQAKEARSGNLYACELELADDRNTLTMRFRPAGQQVSMLLNRIILIKR
jgi:hypothetical protein